MRCYICNALTKDTEIYWEENRQNWSPCPRCISKVKEAQEFELFDGIRTQETPTMPKLRE
jgi:predicted RecB family nuclease